MNNDLLTISRYLFEPKDIVEFRCIRGRDVVKRWTTADEMTKLANELTVLNSNGYNIYYGVNPRKESSMSGDANVQMARCLFCDFDHIEPGDGCGMFEFVYTDLFLAGLPEPALAVHSGHGIHIYWRLTEPVYDLSLWRSMQSQLNERLGADKTIKNPERIMQLPGFLNVKRMPHQDCFICWGVPHA